MLILTRRPGERVVIGDEILVTVMGVSGHTVRLGIEAPAGVPIYREEIWLAVKEENRAAAEAGAELLAKALGEERPARPEAEAGAESSAKKAPGEQSPARPVAKSGAESSAKKAPGEQSPARPVVEGREAERARDDS